jgi:hypothetical protein
MSCDAYSDLASNCASGQSTVFVVVDNAPGNPVKLDGALTTAAFNDIAANTNITDRLGDIITSNPAIFIGGHSAGGYSAIASMKENGGDRPLSFTPAGYLGADPLGPTNFILSRQYGPPIPESKIVGVPTFAIGFTIETCFEPPKQAGLAAYNVTTDENRVMMQVVNKKNFGNQITHCIFTSNGCPACPSHLAGAWVREEIGKFNTLFVSTVLSKVSRQARKIMSAQLERNTRVL